MIMENLIFVGFVLALGVVIFSFYQYVEGRQAKYRDLDKDTLAPPPFKRTISGPNPLEEIQVDFQQRIDTWQRAQMSRQSALKETASEISGQRYHPGLEFTKKESSYVEPGITGRVPQQFKLLG